MPRTSSTLLADHTDVSRWIHLRAAGVSVLIRVPDVGLPGVVHWGRDLGELGAATSSALFATFGAADGSGRPRVRGSRAGRVGSPWFSSAQTSLVSGGSVSEAVTEVGADTVVVQATDPVAELSLDLALQLTGTGLLRARAGVTNTGAETYQLDALDLMVGLDSTATHWIDLDPIDGLRRTRLGTGSVVLPSPKPQSAPAPTYLIVGEEWARYRGGQVWQTQVAFSGAVANHVERRGGRISLGGGELWPAGELGLGPLRSYYSPWVVWSWGDGLDAAAQRIHDHLRSPTQRPAHPVLFDATGPQFAAHDQSDLLQLAEYASAIGSETILLDIDWCTRVGLDPFGDLSGVPDPETGESRDLAGLLDRLEDLDLAVGLAIRPERLPPGSTLPLDHPDWLVAPDGAAGAEPELDLAVRPALVYAWERLTKLLDRHPLTLLRWTMEPATRVGRGSPPPGPLGHGQTLAGYRLLDALRERYPGLAIQTGRADLAMAHRAAAAPGQTDAADRNASRFSWLQVLPPELVEQVVPDDVDPAATPAFRAASGWFGAVGLALDLQQQTPAGLRAIHHWLALHKRFRPLLHGGRLVRSDQSDRGFRLHGVVADAGHEALYAAVWLDRSPSERRVKLEGLAPEALYSVTVVGVRADSRAVNPAWAPFAGDALVTTGAALAAFGVSLPPAPPSSALLLHVEAAAQ